MPIENEATPSIPHLSSLDVWAAVLATVPPPAMSRLENLVDFDQFPDFAQFVTEKFNGEGGKELVEVRNLLVDGTVITRGLLDERILSREDAKKLLEVVLQHVPLYDATLVRQLLSDRIWPEEVPAGEVARALDLLDGLPGVARLGPTLMKFAKHPETRVCGRAAQLISRYTGNAKWIHELYGSAEAAVRANVVEGLGLRDGDVEEFRQLLEHAVNDQSLTVSTMALAILARDGHVRSRALLTMRRRSMVAEVRSVAEYAAARLLRVQVPAVGAN